MSKFGHKIKWTAVNLCRLLVAVTFIISGFVKAVDPTGTLYKLQDYASAFGYAGIVPDWAFLIFAIVLSIFEFCIGIYLFFGIRRKMTTISLMVFMCLMTPLTFYLAWFNPISDCGCFGDAFKLTNWQTFLKNLFLLFASVVLFVYRLFMTRFISERNQWMISMYSIFFIWILASWCLYRLPVLDFRPYHIGANLIEGMQIPEDAEQPEYETTFIMEKDGVQKEFTIEDYPDSTWTFVDSQTRLIKAGYEPLIHDFSMISFESGDDLTEQILADTSYTFLLVSPRLSVADDGRMDLINEVYDYSREYQYAFYCLTASGEDDIVQWCEKTGAEYPFCLSDEITLKTIIRSNPGLLLLKGGVVINKWSHNNLPDETQLNDSLDRLALGQLNVDSATMRFLKLVLWFCVPLVLLTFADRIWIGSKMYKRFKHRNNLLNQLKVNENEKENCSR